MKLDELDHITKSKQIGKILEGHFGFHIDPNRINAESAQLMLDKTTEIIAEFKKSPDFHKSESNPKYLQALMIEQALESLMKEYNWVGKGPDPQKKANTLAPGIKEPDEDEQQDDVEEETNDDFENLYKGQISKSGVAILPSKRTRWIPEIKKLGSSNLAKEALSELKAEQPEIKEENLETEEVPLELKEEASTEEENKSK